MRPMDGYIARIKAVRNDVELELIVQEVFELGFDRGKEATQ